MTYNKNIRQKYWGEVMNKVKEQIKFDFANNCFDVLRLYSAFYVMTLHIFRHIRLQEVSPVFDWWNGVVVLFCISGFLVPASMERSKNTWEFLKTCTANNSVAVGVYNCRSDCGGGILRICAEQDFCDMVSGTACFYTGICRNRIL